MAPLHLSSFLWRSQMELPFHYPLLGAPSHNHSIALRGGYSLALSQACVLGDRRSRDLSLTDRYCRLKGNDLVHFVVANNGDFILWHFAARGSCVLFRNKPVDHIRYDSPACGRQPGEVRRDQEAG